MNKERAFEIFEELSSLLPAYKRNGSALVLEPSLIEVGTEYEVSELKDGEWGVIVSKTIEIWPWWLEHRKFEKVFIKWASRISRIQRYVVKIDGPNIKVQGVVVNPESNGQRVVSSNQHLEEVTDALFLILQKKLQPK